MSKSLKIILFTISGFVVILVLVAMVLHYFVDINSYKPRLDAAASDALGMEVRVGGKMGFRLLPGLSCGRARSAAR